MGNELANIIKQRMEALNLTYEQAAELAEISRPYIAKIIQGTRNPEDATILKLAEALKMDKKELLFMAHRDRAPVEAKDYFNKAVPSIAKIYRELMPDPEYVIEDRYSKRYIELAKKIDRWAKENVEKKKGFVDQFREAQNQVAHFMTRRYRDPVEQKRQEKLLKNFEKLNQEVYAHQKKELQKKQTIGFELPLLTDGNNRDPYLLFEKEKKEHDTWKLNLEKTPTHIPFAYQVHDEAMAPLLQPRDIVIAITDIDVLEGFFGKVVIAKVKGLGTIIRYYNQEARKVIFTSLIPSFPPLVLSVNDVEWIHPIKGIYRGL